MKKKQISPVPPSKDALAFVARAYPGRSKPMQYRLAQAKTLVDQFTTAQSCRRAPKGRP